MLNKLRTTLTHHLWEHFKRTNTQAHTISKGLTQHGSKIVLDHLAIIDLPSKHSGISILTQMLSALGYISQDHGYLPDKQNEFLWLVEIDALEKPAQAVLPQIVVADFWLDALPSNVRQIIEKYTAYIPQPPLRDIQRLAGKLFLNAADPTLSDTILKILTEYFLTRPWPVPTFHDFKTVQEANELLAWVMVFGRAPNHFTISAHLTENFSDFSTFNRFISEDLLFAMNTRDGLVKGSPAIGIEQTATQSMPREVMLADRSITLPEQFMEFVWRYAKDGENSSPVRWGDYFTGFVAGQANRVIESVYEL